MPLKRLWMTGVILAISACCTTEYIPTPVVIPILPLPELPQLTPEQDKALPTEVYEILVRREQILLQTVLNQRTLIEINNEGTK